MINVLFWNVCGATSSQERKKGSSTRLSPNDRRYRNIRNILKLLAVRQSLDFIILAESPFEGNLRLSGYVEARTTLPPNRATGVRMEVYHRNSIQIIGTEVVERAVLHEIRIIASGNTLLLVSTHLDSKLQLTLETLKQFVKELAADIRRKESEINHRRTVLVGDLNWEPYDNALMDAYHLNAVPSKSVAEKAERHVRRDKLPYFYNPMWGHISDLIGSVPGTYYRATKDVDCRFWNMFDQMLVRPELLPYWDDNTVHIIDHSGKKSLLNKNNTPNRKRFSDHLPIIFSLDL